MQKKIIMLLGTGFAALAAPVQAEDDPLTYIIVTGQPTAENSDEISSEDVALPAADAADLAARIPGAAVIDNGAISGQVQYRGLFGERLLVRVNGQRFASGGPNLMDPPLHYAPMPLVDRIEVDRGVSPVRKGPGLGGGINAVLKQVDFGSGNSLAPVADITAGYNSSNDSYFLGGIAGLSNENIALSLLASQEEGDNQRFPGGQIASSSFERINFGGNAALRMGESTLALSYRRQETDPTGNPPFPMDIQYFDTDFLNASFSGPLSDKLTLELDLGYAAVRHLMNNFSLRPPPANPARRRATFADADSATAAVAFRFGDADRYLKIGADIETSDKDVRITNPANALFFITSLNNIQGSRIGGYAEGRFAFGSVESEVGIRIDRHRMDAAAPLLGSAVPMGPRMLASAFASSDRSGTDTTLDVVGRFWNKNGAWTPRLTLARKTRVPNAVERFSWLPTGASGGLADGNIYVGDLNLKAETAWIAEIGVDYESDGFYARPNIYYRRIDNFIQGVPFDATPGIIDSPVEMVANMNGDPTPLRFANVDAEIYGFDMDFGWQIAGPLHMDGTLNYVRGKRRDIDDNLYRIAPPNARLALSWQAERWSFGLEAQAFADQNDVSLTNSEQATEGYLVAGLFGQIAVIDNILLDARIDNILNENYVDHLAGYNRVSGSDIPLGARIPGPGRSAFIRLRWSFR